MTGEKESGETKDEYKNKRKGCKKLLEIYHHLHKQVKVSKKIRRTVLFVHLRWLDRILQTNKHPQEIFKQFSYPPFLL